MLSQGRIKPNSATRQGGSGTTFVAPHKLLMEVNAAGLHRSPAPEPSSPMAMVDTPPTTTTSSGIPHRSSRSGSSLAVLQQEYTAATVSNNGFPNRGAALTNGMVPTTNLTSSSTTTTSSTVNGSRKGVAPINARPVPVSASQQPMLPSSANNTSTNSSIHHQQHPHSAELLPTTQQQQQPQTGGPILSNTARNQQHQQQQQQQLRQLVERDHGSSMAPLHSQNSGKDSVVSDGKSSADSSENSPTVPPVNATGAPFPKAPPLDLNSKATALSGSPRHPMNNVGRGKQDNGSDSSADEVASGRLYPQSSSSTTDIPTTDNHRHNHSSNVPMSPPLLHTTSSATTPSSTTTVVNTATKRATPTPPPSSNTTTSKSNKTASSGHGSSPAVAGSPKSPQIDIGPACQSLSLYDAFSFDPHHKMWVVREDVLAKCLEYIRIMGYQHPAYVQASQHSDKKGKHASSVWCPSATIGSPILPALPQQQQQAAAGAGVPRSTAASPTVPAASKLDDKAPPLNGPQWKLVPLASKSAVPQQPQPDNVGGGDDGSVPAPTITSPPPEEESVCPLFFECEESLRWLAEQEYVIGTILLTCSFEPMSTTEKRAKLKKTQQHSNHHHGSDEGNSPNAGTAGGGPLVRRQYVPAHTHPIRYVAAHVIHNFSHWGDFKSFSAVWDAQVRIVLGVAAPSHQKVIPVPETGLVFSSEFECGNLARVQRHVQGSYNNPFAQSGVCPPGSSTNVYMLWIEGDTQSDKRLWFRFAVSGCRERDPLCIRMMNIAPNSRLYRNGMKPVWRAGASQLQWTAVDDYTFHLINDDRDGELSFYIVPRSSHETIHVAFCVPYSYGDLLCHITQWHALVKRSACNIRFEERVLCRTLDERKLHLLIITSQTEKISGKQQPQQLDSRGRPIQQAGATPYSSFTSGKKVVLISGRVHPGEVTASHAVHGIVSFLLSHDPRATTLREHFIFFVVPMLNPDGVSRGHSRLDQNGLNLNRCYNDPNPATQPTVHSLRNVFDHLQTNFRDRFFMYLDFHSHASQQSGFAFGNHLPNSVQHWNMLYPKLIGIHSNELFDFDTCRFSRGHMVSKDGTSRVLFGGSLIHSYTIELTHFTDFRTFGDRHAATSSNSDLNNGNCPPAATTASSSGASKKPEKGADAAKVAPPVSANGVVLQSPVINGVLCHSADVGRACVLALLDYCSIGDASPDLVKFGGMDRAIREVKREIRGGGPQRPSSYSSQSSFKQY